ALRAIERATTHAAEFEKKAEESLADFRAVSERLGKDYQIRVLENPEDESFAARVTGCFEPGVHIYMDAFDENAPATADRVLVTQEDDAVHTFIRAGGGTRFHSAAASG